MVRKKKDNKMLFLILLGLFLLYAYRQGYLFSVGVDDYIIEDDFTVPSAALSKNAGYCTDTQDGTKSYYTCIDDRWEAQQLTNTFQQGTYKAHFSSPPLTFSGNSGIAYAKYLVNLKNRDIKVKFTTSASGSGCTSGGGSGSLLLTFNDQGVYSGDTSSGPQEGQSDDHLVEMIKHITDSNKFDIIANGEWIKEMNITEDEAYIKFSFSGGGCNINYGSGSAVVHYIKSRPFFNCLLEDNEVFVRQTFGSGVTFTIDDLQLQPVTKFCLDSYPAVLRSLINGGVRADLRGDITRSLARKEAIIVPDNTYLEITYATLYQDGIDDVCNPGEVYDLDKGVCEIFLVEREPEVIMIREREYIEIGKNQKHFVNNLIIGDKSISSGIPSFTCDDSSWRKIGDGDCANATGTCNPDETMVRKDDGCYCKGEAEDWNAPYPSSDCWQTGVTALGTGYTMNDGDTIILNEYLDLTLYISGHYESDDGTVDSYSNNFILTLKNYDFLESFAIHEPQESYWVIFDSNRQMCFDISNDLASFSSSQAGYRLRIERISLVQDETITMNEKAIPLDDTRFCIDIDNSELGKVIYEVSPYFKLGDEIFFDNERIVYSYEIVDEIPTNVTIIYQDRDCRDYGCPLDTSCEPFGEYYVCRETNGNGCIDTSWTPSASTVECGKSFMQESNCQNTRTVTGTKDCPEEKCSFFEKKVAGECELNMTIILLVFGALILLGGGKRR